MSQPAYHLRPNKAVDRLALVDAIRCLEGLAELAEYTYYTLGGPYLEDVRLLYEFFPQIGMVSLEREEAVLERQKFHVPCSRVELKRADLKSFVARYDPKDMKSIFWLDYTGLEYGNFEDFMALLAKVAENSMVKVTLRAEAGDYFDKPDEDVGQNAERFRRQFGAVLPTPTTDPPRGLVGFATLLQEMLQIAAQNALPSATGLMFQPVSSFCYSDGTGIMTLTGVICHREKRATVRKAFAKWDLANLDWKPPRRIDVPVLSTRERLQLQGSLPCGSGAGKTLRAVLGHLIEDSPKKTEKRLQQYADFHRYFPYFMKAIP